MRISVYLFFQLTFISLFSNAFSQENYQLRAQHAGELLYSNEEFSIHEEANFLNIDFHPDGRPAIAGNARCSTQIHSMGTRISSRLVVIANKDRDFNFTRRWMWDNLRPVIVNKIIPMVCPTAHDVNIMIFIRGWDVTATGNIYEVDKVVLPKIQIPKDKDISDGFSRPYHSFNIHMRDFVSFGVVNVGFVLPPGLSNSDRKCEDHIQGCSFETFDPVTPFIPPPPREQLSWNQKPEEKKLLKDKIDEVNFYSDSKRNFNNTAFIVKERYKEEERIRTEIAIRDANRVSLFGFADEIIEKEGFWKVFALGMTRILSTRTCDSGLDPDCIEDVPVIIIP